MKKYLLFLVFILMTYLVSAQTVTGIVNDDVGDPLPGVNVVIKETTIGTITGFDGTYNLSIPDDQSNATLVFSFIGYATIEELVGNRSVIDVGLAPDIEVLSELVVVGYGEQKRVTVTGAVVAIKGDVLMSSPSADLSNSLSGRLPGLVVVQTSGEPGEDGARISIRGTNTLGDSSPLIVIDGIPDREGGLGRLSPNDIASISVLKDASAAIYGARAANGAILITTKRGVAGKPKITYDFNQGWSQPGVVPDMSNATEYIDIMNELPIYRGVPVGEWGTAWSSIQNTGTYTSPTAGVATLSAQFSPDTRAAHVAGNDQWGFPDTDWFGDTFKNWAPQKRHNLSISGGTENLRYYTSLGILDQDAIYKNSATFYKQYSLRINLDAKINDYVSAKIGLMGRREDRNKATEGVGAIFRMLMRGRPNEPAVWPNGLPGPDIENGQNPVAITTNATGFVREPSDYVQANGSIDITNPWVEGLKLTLSGSVDNYSRTQKRWDTPWTLYSWDRISTVSTAGVPYAEAKVGDPLLVGAIKSNFTDPRLSQTNESKLNTNATAMLNYDRTFGDHTINILAGVTRETFERSIFGAFRRNYISPAIEQLFAGGTAGQQTSGSGYERARLGYYGRVQYNFQEKYLAEFIWRRDGSYIFPESDRFGFFPGLLLGWNISNEDFFDVSFIDYLKIRASYGQMGNDQVSFGFDGNGDPILIEYAFLSTYGFNEYPIDGAVETTLQEQLLANPQFTWEIANNYNIGIDATIAGKFDLTLEYFLNRREDILIPANSGSTPQSSGIANILPPKNDGIVENKGFEFNFAYNGGSGDLRYSAGFNGGYSKNEVIFMDEVAGIPSRRQQEGKPIRAYLIYKTDGVFIDQAAIDANTVDYSGVTSQLIPGDIRFQDVDGNGIIDGDDRVRLGESNVPKLQYGATFNLYYKDFDFSLLFQGASGSSVYVRTESGDIGNFLKWSYDHRWSIDNPSDKNPRLASRNDTFYSSGSLGQNDYYLFSANYLRLKNIEIGYTVNSGFLSKAGFENLRFYVNGLNIFTIDSHGIFDPESVNQAGTYYPQSRIINTGFSLTF